MDIINVDSKRNIGLAEMRKDQPYAKHIVRLGRNCFGLIDNDKEYADWQKKNNGKKGV